MTTGRINQVPTRIPRGARRATRRGTKPLANDEEPEDSTQEGAPKRPTVRPQRRTAQGIGHPIAPPEIPRDGPPQHPGKPTTGSHGAAACDPRVKGTGRDHADKRRVSRQASLQESDGERWPAAKDPQTPSAPEAQGPRASAAPLRSEERRVGKGRRGMLAF